MKVTRRGVVVVRWDNSAVMSTVVRTWNVRDRL